MKRKIRISISLILLFIGWLSAFVATGSFGRSSSYLLLPALLLGVGFGLLLKQTNVRQTVIALAATAIFSLVTLNQFFPQYVPRLSSLSNLKPPVNSVQIKVRDVDQVSFPTGRYHLNSYAELEITLFALLPDVARHMIYRQHEGSDQLFVSLPDLGAIYLLKDPSGDGFSEQPMLYHVGLDRPFGMAWIEDRLYVAEPSQLLELMDTTGDSQIDQERVVLSDLPDDGGHWMRGLVADDQGQLYLSIGSRCNACDEEDKRRGTVMKIDPATGQTTEFARGLRNTVGMTLADFDGRLWGTDISRQVDGGVRPPPDELNQIVEGGDYGWPYCFGAGRIDLQLGNPEICRQTLPSRLDLSPASTPMSIAFGRDLMATDPARKALYIVNTGTGTSVLPPDYKVLLLPFNKTEPEKKPLDFLWGWYEQGESWGRPVAVTAGRDGVLYLSDEKNRAIYRIKQKIED